MARWKRLDHLRKALGTGEEELVSNGENVMALRTDDGFGFVLVDDQRLSSAALKCDISHLSITDAKLPVHYAVRSKNYTLLRWLLKNAAWHQIENVEPGTKGSRPIHIAAEINDVTAFKILLEHGADPHARQTDFYGLQAVHIAAAKGSFEILRFVTNEFHFPDAESVITATDLQDSIALHWAVLGYHHSCVKILLERGSGCDYKQRKAPKSTPVHIACVLGSLEIVVLMDQLHPEEFRRALHIQDAQGRTPLHRATVSNNPNLGEYLLEKGAPLDKLDFEGKSCIVLAVTTEAWRTKAVLLKWGANPFDCDPVYQRTTAHHTAMVGRTPATIQTLPELMKKHPDWKFGLDALDGFGYTALQYAAGYGNTATFNRLLQGGASIDVKNSKGKTVLHYAAKYGQLEIVRTLMSLSGIATILNIMDHQGRCALHLASSHGHHEVVLLLLHKGAYPFRDDSGKTPFHAAAEHNHHEIMRSIISTFALLLNSAAKDGSTAMHLAAANNAAESVRYLLGAGAMATEDSQGRTPMDLAIFHQHEKAALAFVNSRNGREIVMHPSRAYGNVVLGLITHLPEVMKRCLDRCVTKSKKTKLDECYLTYDFSILNPVTDVTVGYKRRKAPINPLQVMAKHGRSALLEHPVCITLLERKWATYGMYCSGIIMTSHLVFVALLSYIIVSSATSGLRPHLLRKSYENIERNYPEALNGSKTNAFAEMYRMGHFPKTPEFRDTPSLVVLGIAVIITFIKEFAQILSMGRQYFMKCMNYVEVTLFITCAAFVFCFYEDDASGEIGPYTYQFGAVAVFLAWFSLLRSCRPFGTFGIYSLMFLSILKTLLHVSFFFFILTAAFTGAFSIILQTYLFPNSTEYYLLEPEVEPSDLKTAHTQVHVSALQIGAMTIGDLDELDTFVRCMLDGKVEYPFLTFIFYMGLLLLLPILLSNLLTGLAIGDMAAIQANAVALRLQMQVYLHDDLEKLFPAKLLKKIRKRTRCHRVYPGRRSGFKTWPNVGKSNKSSGEITELEKCLKPEEESKTDDEITKLTARLEQLKNEAVVRDAMLIQIISQLDKIVPYDDQLEDDAFSPLNVAKRVRKRSEREEDDIRHLTRRQTLSRREMSGTHSLQI